MEIVKIKIPSLKGDMSAVIHYPENHTNKLAILCPGYLDTKDYKHLVRLAENLTSIGYTAVRFDPTGTWESGGEIKDCTTTQYLNDIKSVIDHMVNDADFQHILVGGHSRGGMMSILHAARDPRVSIVLGIMPSNSSIGRKNIDEWKTSGFRTSVRELPNYTDEYVEYKVPYSHAEDIIKYDVITDTNKVKVPIILFAGELDETCPPGDVEKIYQNANEPKKFIIIPSIGHDYRKSDEEIGVVNSEILKQLKNI